MFSFRSILVAAAAFATIVSAVPTPEVGSGLVQRTPGLPGLSNLPVGGGLPVGNLPALGGDSTPAKRGGSGPNCYERIKKCHDDISVIVIKIGESWISYVSFYLLFKYEHCILEAAVKVGGGAKDVDCDLVVSLLWEIVELLKGLLYDLKLIVKAEIILGCTLEVLAEIVGALLIVCPSFFCFLVCFRLIFFNVCSFSSKLSG